jgi:hypothetical protein
MIETRVIKSQIEDTKAIVMFQKYYIDDDTKDEDTLGKSFIRQYDNGSTAGRQRVIDELPENIKDAIFAVWGDEPVSAEA